MHNEDVYINKFLEPLRVCKNYKPKFGKGNKEEGFSLEQFLDLYGDDAFYAWCGLNSPLMYAAHKAAGGMTSIYRQLGKGCEFLFREIIIDSLEYKDRSFAEWSYTTSTKSGKQKTLSLDARILLSEISNVQTKTRVQRWIEGYCCQINSDIPRNGVVFEVRQGYKSKDSKRQNGDIDNIAVAWANSYLPIFAIFSGQIDLDNVLRYKNNRAGIVIGELDGNVYSSLYHFCDEVLNFDLVGFFRTNQTVIKNEMNQVLKAVLNA